MDLSFQLLKLYHKLNLYPSIIKTDKGLSNDIYLITLDEQKYILRIPSKDINDLLSKDEESILKLSQKTDLDALELYYDPITKVRLTKYIEDYQEFKDAKDYQKYTKAIDAIKKLHSFNFKANESFNIKEKYYRFKANITHPLMDYQKYEAYLDALTIKKEIFSHNDLVSGNILFTKDKTYLIDYEYAGNNHPYFDLVSFLSENNIDNQRLRKLLIKYYFNGDIDDDTKRELHILFINEYLLWAAWANMLYDSRGEDIYLEIFNDKYKHLLDELKRT